MKQNEVALFHDFARALIGAASALEREGARLFRPLEIAPAQFNVLNLLADEAGGLRPTDITRLMVVDPSSTTYVLDEVEKRGWVTRERNPNDRRSYSVALTAAGRSMHRRALPVYEAALRELPLEIDPAQLRKLTGILSLIAGTVAEAVDRAEPGLRSREKR